MESDIGQRDDRERDPDTGAVIILVLESYYQQLMQYLPESPTPKQFGACQRFSECMYRLENRRTELHKIENEMFQASQDSFERSLNEIQHDFVDKTEAFHQHVYATISAFVMLLNHVTPKEFRELLPKRSVGKFLSFLNNRYPELAESIEQLELSRSFRAKAIDHIQQHQIHNWMTYGYPKDNTRLGSDYVIIYFIPAYTPEDTAPFPATPDSLADHVAYDPRSKYFRLPIGHKSYYVTPHAEEVFLAMKEVSETVLRSL